MGVHEGGWQGQLHEGGWQGQPLPVKIAQQRGLMVAVLCCPSSRLPLPSLAAAWYVLEPTPLSAALPLFPLLQVRKAFTADTAANKTLIVADYGQLELRILAHMARCRSMIQAFELGGDFHSRTALGMYDHIQQAVGRGE
jgi:hypothetical protein